jgi:hypothetical protein
MVISGLIVEHAAQLHCDAFGIQAVATIRRLSACMDETNPAADQIE